MTLTSRSSPSCAIAAAAGWFARSRAPGCAAAGASTACPSITALYAPLGGVAGAADPVAGLDADPDRPGRPGGARLPGGPAAARLRDAARHDPGRGAGDRAGEIEAGFNPESARWRRSIQPAEALRRDRRRYRLLVASPARRLPYAADRGRLPRAHRGRAMGDGAAGRRLADRHPDDARHRPVAAVREPALLQPGQPDRIPVRDDLEPADRDPRRPGRLVGRVRLDPACSGARPSSARSSP